ncbi:hypothetical protein [Kytococcus sedentarius]|uniref:hypothetical protein n=1 Tax=Kytococcus sedentarius TaxID=1276 RepID=UPI001951DF0E|nr:hypothetical protein [Kytococcus sedentarius]QRO86613.1 hypothetical protein I6J30_06930 [Kytococcus sedentarius]
MQLTGKIFTLLGVLGLVGAVVLGVLGVRSGVATDEAVRSGQEVGQSLTAELESGDTYLLTLPLDSESATCAVSGPDGGAVGSNPTDDDEIMAEGTVDLVGALHPDASGEHVIRCSSPEVKLTDPVDSMGYAWAGLGILGALLLGLGSAALLFVGVILWIWGANRDRDRRDQWGNRGGGYGGGYGGTGGYGSGQQGGWGQGGPGQQPGSGSGGYPTPPPPPQGPQDRAPWS